MKIFNRFINKIKGICPSLSTVGKVAKYTTSILLIIVGILGLVLAYINPMPYIASAFPIIITCTIINITQANVQTFLTFLNVNLIYTIAISSTLIVAGLAFNIRNIKAAPMGIIRLPIKAYRRVSIWRNWILAKVNYLNEESAKW